MPDDRSGGRGALEGIAHPILHRSLLPVTSRSP
jgi:hypothetical protein